MVEIGEAHVDGLNVSDDFTADVSSHRFEITDSAMHTPSDCSTLDKPLSAAFSGQGSWPGNISGSALTVVLQGVCNARS